MRSTKKRSFRQSILYISAYYANNVSYIINTYTKLSFANGLWNEDQS